MNEIMLDTASINPLYLRSGFLSNKKVTVTFLFLIVTIPVFSQSGKIVSIGLGPEINNNSGHDFGISVGAVLGLDFNLGNYWALGLAAKGSHDLSSAWVLEGGGLLRVYFPGKPPQQKETHSGFFLQADAGVHYIAEDNVFMYEGDTLLRFMGGLRLGYRFLLGRSRFFYLEPYARGGYPFLWGAGLLAGFRF